mmetsp:Transcript_3324/g.3829  ORF Transcript_3324/g.3829 Transcript_3324/m.3829 type:complete len:94 (+) Transcript_3324:209-490(+)
MMYFDDISHFIKNRPEKMMTFSCTLVAPACDLGLNSGCDVCICAISNLMKVGSIFNACLMALFNNTFTTIYTIRSLKVGNLVNYPGSHFNTIL